MIKKVKLEWVSLSLVLVLAGGIILSPLFILGGA